MDPFDDFDLERDLSLELTLSVPRSLVWRCWTEPALMRQWYAPAPWTTPDVAVDPRPGGAQRITMASPEGTRHTYDGLYLDVVPQARLVTLGHGAALAGMFETPFMMAVLTFADTADGGTRYRARSRHYSRADRDTHAAMGFEPGWTAAARQLETLARTLTAPA
ncbi:MAG: SRPBCC family protein [Acuticoccus sp.]